MADDGFRYRIGDQIYTYHELRAVTEADVADLPTETWGDGRFDFDDYLTESVHTGTIEVVENTLLRSGIRDSPRGRFGAPPGRLYALTFKHFEDLLIGDAPTFAQVADLGYGCF